MMIASTRPSAAKKMPKAAATSANGSTISPTSALKTNRSSRNGSRTSARGRTRIPNSRPATSRNGSVRRRNISGLTSGGLHEFRGFELIGGPARRRRGEVLHGLVRQPFLEALDDRRRAARGLLRLREAEQDAEAYEEREHEGRADCRPFHNLPDRPHDIPETHTCSSRGGLATGTS